MRAKIFFLAIVGFWVVMNYLLWRSQWGAHSNIGNEVPPEVVWEKILTAPDTSSLDIFDHTNKIGICHWIANVGQVSLSSSKILAADYDPEIAEEQVTGYSLTFEGNATLAATNRIRFETGLELSTNRDWKTFHVRVVERPRTMEVRAIAAAEKVTLKVEDNSGTWQKTLSFTDLHNPETLWTELGGSPTLGWIAAAGMMPSKESFGRLASSLRWQAHEDWVQFGHNKARAFHLETTFLGRKIHIYTSRVGEILWVEFPNKITFQNEAFEHF